MSNNHEMLYDEPAEQLERVAPLESFDLEAIKKLGNDVRSAARTLSVKEVRFLVDLYYMVQNHRIRSDAQARALRGGGEPNEVFLHFGNVFVGMEKQLVNVLQAYAEGQYIGRWMMNIYGIGPVIAAGFMAHIDITKAPTAGHIWAYAGYDPNREWLGREGAKKVVEEAMQQAEDWDQIAAIVCKRIGSTPRNFIAQLEAEGGINKANLMKVAAKRPWNADLKVLCWKAGQSFVKQNPQKCQYRRLYTERKVYENMKNLNGEYAEQAARELASKNYTVGTETQKALAAGRLSPAHISARCERYAVKIFLSHLQQVWFEHYHGRPAPAPFPIAHQDHAHMIDPPEFNDPGAPVIKVKPKLEVVPKAPRKPRAKKNAE